MELHQPQQTGGAIYCVCSFFLAEFVYFLFIFGLNTQLDSHQKKLSNFLNIVYFVKHI